MARTKNGWVKLYTTILDKGFSAVEFKIFVGLLLLANTIKHKNPGLIDLPIRDISKRLNVSIGAFINARDRFISEGRLEIVKIPTRTKPVDGIKVINFYQYQDREFVSPSEQSRECSLSRTKKVSPSEQKVSPSEQSVSPSEQSRAQNRPPENSKEYTESLAANNLNNLNETKILTKAYNQHLGEITPAIIKALVTLTGEYSLVNVVDAIKWAADHGAEKPLAYIKKTLLAWQTEGNPTARGNVLPPPMIKNKGNGHKGAPDPETFIPLEAIMRKVGVKK